MQDCLGLTTPILQGQPWDQRGTSLSAAGHESGAADPPQVRRASRPLTDSRGSSGLSAIGLRPSAGHRRWPRCSRQLSAAGSGGPPTPESVRDPAPQMVPRVDGRPASPGRGVPTPPRRPEQPPALFTLPLRLNPGPRGPALPARPGSDLQLRPSGNAV
ncbi:hypothetical protein NDU88_006405 [Pleurodeles waltl]|uniref:Uncharacterized protein n=1 Tax=Pleurodeles waltl TaxID=8319 RepID=A0AAV7MDC3_PLEWA|nr:hypothetical protein NDU88_006405 [Pleurodeles waltl]